MRLRAVVLVLAFTVFACRRSGAQEALRITIRRASVDLAVGDTTTIIAVVSIISQEAPATVSWSSDNGRIASVDRNGLVTARAAGVAVITARLGTAFATTRVSVPRTSSAKERSTVAPPAPTPAAPP
jgi:uncharacterized protein YjdB